VTELIGRLRAAEALSALDAELALHLGELGGEAREEVLLAIALASRATRDGHVCADLAKLAGSPIEGRENEVVTVCPPFGAWRELVSTSTLVGAGPGPTTLGSPREGTPLILDERGRLYLRRHWEHERALAAALGGRSLRTIELADPAASRRLLERLFGPHKGGAGAPDWQRIAAELAALSSLTVISGGPGTGKTSTVTKIIALCLADELARGNAAPRALLLAPTGKAASRLSESARNAAATLDCPKEVLERIPLSASTVHRALEADGEGRFRLTKERPLVADVVAVDEASMIDVALMRALVDAVPAHARLVLLGDRDQLASVEAGAVLADICGARTAPRYSASLDERVALAFGERLPAAAVSGEPPGIDDSVVTLTESHRFRAASPLGELARAIQRGDADAVARVFAGGTSEVTLLEPKDEREPHPALSTTIVDGFRSLAAVRTPEEALAALEFFRVLSAHRRGSRGVEELNRAIVDALESARLLGSRSGLMQPIIVNRNDSSIGLFNGDVGVLFRDGTDGARAFFPAEDGRVRRLSPSRLPPSEPAFAMSIHKSQGSEFDEVVVMLPALGSPLLSRELFYTAVTRARRRVVVHGSAASIREAVVRSADRASGLADALRKP
jgi:exodeoxyribonuclease V alpha subunit